LQTSSRHPGRFAWNYSVSGCLHFISDEQERNRDTLPPLPSEQKSASNSSDIIPMSLSDKSVFMASHKRKPRPVKFIPRPQKAGGQHSHQRNAAPAVLERRQRKTQRLPQI
jgi:hypothetical protein